MLLYNFVAFAQALRQILQRNQEVTKQRQEVKAKAISQQSQRLLPLALALAREAFREGPVLMNKVKVRVCIQQLVCWGL